MSLLALPLYRLTDANGVIIPNGRLYSFVTGTLTAAATYTTSGLSVSHGPYVQANSAGLLPPIYLDPVVTYRFQVRASPYSSAVSGMDFDPVSGATASDVSFTPSGADAETTTVQEWLRGQTLAPEDFGAAGDGTTNDAPAFVKLFTAQQSTGLPIRFKPGATYGIGVTGWTGISVTLSRNMVIDGAGATIKLLVAPSQTAQAGAVNPFFIFDGTASKYKLTIENVLVNFNSIKEPCFNPYRCTIDFRNNRFTNGDMGVGGAGDASIAFYLLACTGIGAFNYTKNVGYQWYLGHTNAGMPSDGLQIVNNRGEQFYNSDSTRRGDFFVGTFSNSEIAHNIASGIFGNGLSGLASQSTVCTNVHVHDNEFSDFTASGIQTDIVGNISATGLNIHDNLVRDAVDSANPLYFLQVEDSKIHHNRGENAKSFIVVDDAADVSVDHNDFDAGTAATPGVGISLVGQVGTIDNVLVGFNRVKGFATNIGIGGAGSAVSDIEIIGNTTIGGAYGLRIQETGPGPVTGLWVDGNNFAGGHSTKDIDNGATNGQLGVQFGQNKFATATGVAQVLPVAQPTPTAKTGDATLTIAELLTGIVTATSASAVALTLPTGTLTDAGMGAFAIGQAFEWTVINLGSASGAVTMTAGTDHTYVGNATVAISTSARFRTRKTAANTFVTYRIS